jgi:hypothetical protein
MSKIKRDYKGNPINSKGELDISAGKVFYDFAGDAYKKPAGSTINKSEYEILICADCGRVEHYTKGKRYRCRHCGSQQVRTYSQIRTSAAEEIGAIEKRFKDVAGIDEDLTVFPIQEHTETQVITDKEKSDEFGEVFTPLYMVDKMVSMKDDDFWLDQSTRTHDQCAGYGQFTVRILRKRYNVAMANNNLFGVYSFFNTSHVMSEIQLSSVYKLLYIFGKKINLFIGDSSKIHKIHEDDYLIPKSIEHESGMWKQIHQGILYYSDKLKKWIDVSEEVSNMLGYCHNSGPYKEVKCNNFITKFENHIKSIEKAKDDEDNRIKEMKTFSWDKITGESDEG